MCENMGEDQLKQLFYISKESAYVAAKDEFMRVCAAVAAIMILPLLLVVLLLLLLLCYCCY